MKRVPSQDGIASSKRVREVPCAEGSRASVAISACGASASSASPNSLDDGAPTLAGNTEDNSGADAPPPASQGMVPHSAAVAAASRTAASFFPSEAGFFDTEHSQTGREHKVVLFVRGAAVRRPAGKVLFTQRADAAGTIDHVAR